jgi:long-chain acyl-CoA synthetase
MDASQKKTLSQNITLMIDAAWEKYADRNLLAYTLPEKPTEWIHVTGAEARERVDAVAKGLIAIGVKPGDRVGIMSRTRIEWAYLDFAIWAAGAISVPIYDTSAEDQVDWITSDSGIKLVFVESVEHLALAHAVAKGESPLHRSRCHQRPHQGGSGDPGRGPREAQAPREPG